MYGILHILTNTQISWNKIYIYQKQYLYSIVTYYNPPFIIELFLCLSP